MQDRRLQFYAQSLHRWFLSPQVLTIPLMTEAEMSQGTQLRHRVGSQLSLIAMDPAPRVPGVCYR